MKGDLCGKILSRGIEQQNAVGLEKISVDRDAVLLIHPLSLILSPCPYAIGRRISSRTGYPSCGQVHVSIQGYERPTIAANVNRIGSL